MISVATAVRNAISSSVNTRGSRVATLRTPNGWSWLSIGTLRLLTTPSSSRVGDGVNRVSVAMSSTIVGSPVRSVCAAASLSLRLSSIARAPIEPSGNADGGGDREPLAGLVELEHAAHVDVERGARRPQRLGHQLAEVVAPQREATERRDGVLLAGVARDLLRGMGALGDIAGDDEQGLDEAVLRVDGYRLDGERQALAGELERLPLVPVERGVVVVEAELEDVVGELGVQIGHPAAAEHRRVEEPEPPDRLAVGDQDAELVIEKEHGRVGQVGGQRAVQRLGVADQQLGLAPLGLARPGLGDVLRREVQDAVEATVVQLRTR